MSKKNTLTDFEKSLKKLEELVETMERGELSLEESISHFEQGMALTQACQQALTQAEKKVKMLTENKETGALEDPESDT